MFVLCLYNAVQIHCAMEGYRNNFQVLVALMRIVSGPDTLPVLYSAT